MNPFARVPTIEDRRNGFVLYESHAILRYLSDSFEVPEHWYPRKDLEIRAKID